MKKIEAFIRHEAFEPIRLELLEKGFPSLSVAESVTRLLAWGRSSPIANTPKPWLKWRRNQA